MGAAVEHGAPEPLGAHFDGEGVNFALFSAHAERVELCLFDEGAELERERVTLPARTGDVWHGRVPGLRPGQLYGYRVHGPYAPEDGHRFNPARLLLDPYARMLAPAPRGSAGLEDAPPGDAAGPDPRDSAPFTPRARVVEDRFDWEDERRPATAPGDTVIYEAHVRGLTQRHPDVEPTLRGTFPALHHPAVIEHLHRIGVTAVELLPVHAFVDEPFLRRRGLRNYWGYSPIGFFAPEMRYLGGAGPEAFKTMVRDLHRAGIEVILDVVYNHTAEGSHLGPTLSFRGIDNASYYRLDPHRPDRYVDYTGCGNTLDLSHPQVLTLVLDSLRYWATEMRVDGFRFDLATTLARGEHGFEATGTFFTSIIEDPVLRQLKLIAEPWDLGPDGYRLGGFAPGWCEWNDRYRDTIRRFWLEDALLLPEFARRVHGSADLFDHPGRGPQASVNFVASHDGFTLRDLVSYEHRHNEANSEENRDGHRQNHSRNHGVEGDSRDPAVNRQRDRAVRNLLATVFLSQGTPMLLAGDELGRTQGGNNNAYCQDNETSWLDWEQADPVLIDFVAQLSRLRKRFRVLRRGRFAHGEPTDRLTGLPDITWLGVDGTPMTERDWHTQRSVGLVLSEPGGEPGAPPETLLIVFNGSDAPSTFALPGEALSGVYEGWRIVLASDDAPELDSRRVRVPALSLCVLEARVKDADA